MSYREPLSQCAIAISVSDSPDMAGLGLAPEHLRDAMTEIARHLLAMGARLVYGGDLRVNGFTELLFELVARHRRDADIGDQRPAILNFLAWPVAASIPPEDLRRLVSDLRGMATLHVLDRDGGDIPLDALDAPRPTSFSADDWAVALTAMRRRLTAASHARIVLGGRVQGFKGRMPGIAEEALAALEAGQPLYVMGGFGGCTRDVAIMLGALNIPGATPPGWPEAALFQGFGLPDLQKNGLTADENRTLARTVHVDQAIALILRGLLRLQRPAQAD